MGGYGEKIWKDPEIMKYFDATRLDSRETGTAIFVRFQDSLMLWKEYNSDFSEKAAQRDACILEALKVPETMIGFVKRAANGVWL